MITPDIVVKTEMDFDFIANYTMDCGSGGGGGGGGDTQHSQGSQSGGGCNTKPSSLSNAVATQQGVGAQLETMATQQHAACICMLQHMNPNNDHVNDDDDAKLLKWLKDFNLEILYTTLKLNDITYRSLKYLTIDDINAAIRHIGYRAEFREKLFVWRKEKLSTADKGSNTQSMQPASANMVNKKTTPTSIVAPAISVQSVQQQQQQQQQLSQTAQSTSQQANTANAANNAIATLTVIPSHVANSSSSSCSGGGGGSATATILATATPTMTTGSATIIKRNTAPAPAEDFLSLLPGVSSTSGHHHMSTNNMPAVVLEPTTLDLRNAFNSFIPQTGKSAKLQSMATLTTAATTTTTHSATATATTTVTATAMATPPITLGIVGMTTGASTKSTNAEQHFMLAGGASGSSGIGSGESAHASGSRASTNIGGSVSSSSCSSSNLCMAGDGYAPKGPLIMNCTKVDVSKVLQSSIVGQRIKQFYNKKGYLENHQRNEIVRLIVADVMHQGETLSPKDLRAILNDIITIFPNEQAAADYYFIYRAGKGNPLGRLYQRYSNENVKRRRMIRLSDDEDCNSYNYNDVDMPQHMHSNQSLMDDDDTMSIMYPQELPGHVPRIDEMTALALKQLLTTDHFSWEEVCDKWIQTWALRHKELQQSGLSELLSNWSKLADPRAAELYKIDFRHVYPNKENLLVGKWDTYIKKVTPQLDKKLQHEDLKTLYKYCKMGMASKDEKDFLYAVGLTALLPSTGRFKDHYGKLSIRANLTDSIDSFVMRLNTLESYESRLDLYNRKYGPINRTTHPFLVVIMPNECTISKIYVALENHFYCMQSFLQALDLCYKIYHTCGLKYPTMCENVWTFVQKYFYDMTVPWEARNANLVSLVVSLTMQQN